MTLAPLTFINEGFITKQCPSNVRSATKDMKRNENMLNIFYKVTTLFTNIMFEKYLFDHKVFSLFFLDGIEGKKTSFSFVLVVYFQNVSVLLTKINKIFFLRFQEMTQRL